MAILVTLTIIIIVLMRLPTSTINLIAVGIFGTIALAALSGLVLFCLLAYERVLLQRAKRRELENKITVASAGDQVIASEYVQGRWFHTALHYPETQEQLPLWLQHSHAYGTRKPDQIVEQVHPLIESPKPKLQELIKRDQRLLFFGPSGSGKSSLLRHTVRWKMEEDIGIILIDPHGSRPKWGDSVDAVGFGENWEEIIKTFQKLEGLHSQRIKQIANGHPERDFPLMMVVIEELQELVEFFNSEKVDIGHYIRMLLTRTRKTGIDVIAVSQEKTAGALGLSGFMRNRDAFTIIECHGKDGYNHKVVYQDSQNELEYDPPPYWPDTLPVGVNQVVELPDDLIVDLPMPDRIRDILELYDSGVRTPTEICERLHGYRSGEYTPEIKQIIEKYRP